MIVPTIFREEVTWQVLGPKYSTMSLGSNSPWTRTSNPTSSCHLIHSSVISARKASYSSLCQFILTESQTFSTNFLSLRNEPIVVVGSNGSLHPLNLFTFCKRWQTSVICFSQTCNTSTKLSIFTNTLSRKEFFVSSKCFCTLTIADGIQVTQLPNFSTAKAKWSKIAGSKSSLAVVNGTWRSEQEVVKTTFSAGTCSRIARLFS